LGGRSGGHSGVKPGFQRLKMKISVRLDQGV